MECRPPRSPLARLAFGLVFGGAISCQAVFGDYRIDTSNIVPDETVSCLGGESRCRGAVLETCAADGRRWEAIETCASAALCNLGTDSCSPCTLGEYQCNERELRHCESDGTWKVVQDCTTAELCALTLERNERTCAPRACANAGEYRCDGPKLQRCPDTFERWQDIEICASPALCDAELANQRALAGEPVHCVPAICQPNQFACEGATLKACNATRDGWQTVKTCPSAALCNPKAGDCAAAMPGDHACSGATLQRFEGGRWSDVATCDSPALCAAAGPSPGCEPPVCQAGAVLCEPESTRLSRCRTDLSYWEKVAVCPSQGLCNAGAQRCEPAACRINAVRCMGSRLERCATSFTGWELDTTCGRDEVCDPVAGCIPGRCAEGTQRCNERYLERCNQGRWERLQRCTTPELCDAPAGTCKEPVCGGDLPLFACQGQTALKCADGRHRFEDFDFCTNGTTCLELNGTCR